MNINKMMIEICDDLEKNAMPFKTYVYEVKRTHQIIRKHLVQQKKEEEKLNKEVWDCLSNIFNKPQH